MEQRYGNICIREAALEDAQQLCTWWNDGKVMEHAGLPNGLGTTVDEVKKQIEEKRTGNACDNQRHIILWQNTPIGEMNYHEVDAGVCEIGIKICDFSMQNKGLGKIILSLFITALFGEYGYKKLSLEPI